MKAKAILETPLGRLLIEGDRHGISRISYTDEALSPQETPDDLREAISQLKAYFDGDLKIFDLSLNSVGTAFQKRVWNVLLEIPYGKTVSYKDQAIKLGDIKAIRAVAAANGKNPLPIIVPCHRVIGSDGSLTGYAGGLWRKKWLLRHENALKQPELFD